MGRWEPDARGRLAQAALALFAEQGVEQTTVAQIAGRAGLTERTFFRHFADKREVLFHGSESMVGLMAGAVAGAPAGASPIEAVSTGLEVVAAMFEENPERVRTRDAVVAAHPELQERELIKMAQLAAAVASALRARGTGETAARLTAETGIAVFKVAYARWVADPGPADLPQLVRESLQELRRELA